METKSRKTSTPHMMHYTHKFSTLEANGKRYDPNRPHLNKKPKHKSIHGHRWSAGRIELPPSCTFEEVVQVKLVKEHTRRERELHLRVRGLPLCHPSLDPLEIGTMFLRDTLDLPDVALERAWLGYDSTLFLGFRTMYDRLRALRARQKLFSLPNRILLDEDLIRSQVAELKHSRELVMAAQQAGKWEVIRNIKVVIWDSFPPGWGSRVGASK